MFHNLDVLKSQVSQQLLKMIVATISDIEMWGILIA